MKIMLVETDPEINHVSFHPSSFLGFIRISLSLGRGGGGEFRVFKIHQSGKAPVIYTSLTFSTMESS